ncbi:TonB-dependent receptor plug domain-containing protein [Hymenobacter aerophilus]|uniref:TonB-dependent receptor plug domain-containing protein n=1 Tax=Hymenobacter aerophilus TaxID=119644 RepID=UPI000372D8CC|nr:TonB-dependent receptor plug domain-containing protein [Hymenobacter aerophilus]
MNRFLLLPLLLLGFAASAQTTTPTDDTPRIGLGQPAFKSTATASLSAKPDPIYVVNGQVMDSFELLNISPDQIKSMSVVKGSKAVSLYGDKGKNGIVLITTISAKTNCE